MDVKAWVVKKLARLLLPAESELFVVEWIVPWTALK